MEPLGRQLPESKQKADGLEDGREPPIKVSDCSLESIFLQRKIQPKNEGLSLGQSNLLATNMLFSKLYSFALEPKCQWSERLLHLPTELESGSRDRATDGL
jgi:hypothetical protein